MVLLGEILKLDRREVSLEPDNVYRTAGIYSFGRGLFERERIRGSDTSYPVLYRLEFNHFVISRLNGWEGAVDVVTADLVGCHVSNEYPTFSVDESRALPSYMAWIARWPGFWERLTPRGSMVRRKRVHLPTMMQIEVPLPTIGEQQRIVDELDRLHYVRAGAETHLKQATSLSDALSGAAVASLLDRGVLQRWPIRSLADVAEVNPRPERLQPSNSIAFVPMAAVDAATGLVVNPELRAAGDVGPGYKQFRRGDVIFARITPCMQNGKSAIFEGPTDFGYGSTEFHVLRPGPELTATWLHRVVRTSGFRSAAAERFSGTAGQQRVPADFMRTVGIPVPPPATQKSAVLAIDRIHRASLGLTERRRKQRLLLAALEPSALNHVFA